MEQRVEKSRPLGYAAIDEAYRRGYEQARQDYTFEYAITGPLIIQIESGLTYSRENLSTPIPFTPTQARMMALFAQHLGNLVPEPLISRAIWQTDDEDRWGSRASRIRYVQTMVSRLNTHLREAGVTSLRVMSGPLIRKNSGARMLPKLPPEGEKGGTSEESVAVGYSRAEARKIIVNGLTHLREGRTAEAEALFQAAVNGLPDALESAANAVGRPNMDQRVIEALVELGADKEYVKLRDVASHVRMTPALTAKALLRARDRRPDIMHKRRLGYRFATNGRTNATPTPLPVDKERATP